MKGREGSGKISRAASESAKIDHKSGRNFVKEQSYLHSRDLLCHTFMNKMTYDLLCPGRLLVCDALLIHPYTLFLVKNIIVV